MKLLTVILFVCSPIAMATAQNMEELFVKIPDRLIVQLEEAWRKDLVDLYKSGKTATLENTMQGKSSLLKLTDDYLLLQSTERSTVELKRLPLVNNTHIICMITTVTGPVADSRVDFYTTAWQRLSPDGLFMPVAASLFWNDDAPEDVKYASPAFVKYTLSAENQTLTAEYTTPLFWDEESRLKNRPLLKGEPKVYTWKLSHFE